MALEADGSAKAARSIFAPYGAILGEQYSVPLQFRGDGDDCEVQMGSSSNCSTAASSESGSVSALLLLEEEEEERRSNSMFTVSDAVFHCLGFESNPMRDANDSNNNNSDHDAAVLRCSNAASKNHNSRNSAAADLRLSMLSNFSSAYNVISISLSLQMMKQYYVSSSSSSSSSSANNDPAILLLSMTPRDESICSSALIAGMILGQLTMGALGDVLGRHRAMAVVMLLQVASSFGSSCSCHFSSVGLSVFEVLAFWRFLLGLGCGGVYPLSATLTTESSHSGKDRAKLVALTFSFQGVGYLVVPIISLLIVSVLGESSDLGWRILLGLGCVPGIVLTIGRYRSSRSSGSNKSHQPRTGNSNSEKSPLRKSDYVDLEEHLPPKGRAVPVSILDAISLERNLVRKLLGTAGSWLLFDILFYGNTLFQPVVLSAAFGTAETVAKASRDTLIIALVALPGYYVTVLMVGRQSPRFIQLQGFFIMGILYLTIGILFEMLSSHWIALLSVYGSTFFFSNYGPNATTFMLPSMTFSRSCRSTLNGVSAASGKAGALIGATVFVSACRAYGQETVFMFCALLSFAGCFLTLCCVSENVGQGDDDDDDDENNERLWQEYERLGRASVPMKRFYSKASIFDSNPSSQ